MPALPLTPLLKILYTWAIRSHDLVPPQKARNRSESGRLVFPQAQKGRCLFLVSVACDQAVRRVELPLRETSVQEPSPSGVADRVEQRSSDSVSVPSDSVARDISQELEPSSIFIFNNVASCFLANLEEARWCNIRAPIDLRSCLKLASVPNWTPPSP